MKCVECGSSIDRTFEHNNNVKGNNDTISLSKCQHCGEVADKYCEDQFVIVFLDLILHKKQAFRHVLYNRFSEDQKPISFFVFMI